MPDELKELDLLAAARSDDVIDIYDKAAIEQKLKLTTALIYKEKIKLVVPQLVTLSAIASLTAGSYFGFMDNTTTISIAGVSSGSVATLFKKDDELVKQLNKKKL